MKEIIEDIREYNEEKDGEILKKQLIYGESLFLNRYEREKLKEKDYDLDYEGYIIKTNINTYLLLIDHDYQCCESVGHVSTSDDIKEAIGDTLISVSMTSKADNKIITKSVDFKQDAWKSGFWENMAMFLNISTNNRDIQFCIYNIQNGYYGHRALLKIHRAIYKNII